MKTRDEAAEPAKPSLDDLLSDIESVGETLTAMSSESGSGARRCLMLARRLRTEITLLEEIASALERQP